MRVPIGRIAATTLELRIKLQHSTVTVAWGSLRTMADLAVAGARTAIMYRILDQTAKALLPPCDEIDYVSGRQDKLGVRHRRRFSRTKRNPRKEINRALLDARLVLHGD